MLQHIDVDWFWVFFKKQSSLFISIKKTNKKQQPAFVIKTSLLKPRNIYPGILPLKEYVTKKHNKKHYLKSFQKKKFIYVLCNFVYPPNLSLLRFNLFFSREFQHMASFEALSCDLGGKSVLLWSFLAEQWFIWFPHATSNLPSYKGKKKHNMYFEYSMRSCTKSTRNA